MKKTLYIIFKYLFCIFASIILSHLWATTNFEAGVITLLTFIYVAILDLKD